MRKPILLRERQATYTVLSGAGLGAGLLDSPHFMQLCSQSSRYFSSLARTASAALPHRSPGSSQPASLHSVEMNAQHSWASFASNATRLVRTSKQSSLASMHVLTYLNRFSACSRILWRLSSNFSSPATINESNYLSHSFFLYF